MNIVQALHDERFFKPLFKDLSSWHSWEIFLKALFNLPIEDAKDKRFFKDCTGLKSVPRERVKECFCIVGRRGGKSFTSSLISVYLACFKDWRKFLSPGERGYIFIVSCDKTQSQVINGYIKAILHSNKSFEKLIERETTEQIDLINNVSIMVKTASYRSLRGFTILACIMDELAFFRSEESANPDKEILAAVRPALATIEDSLLLGISTPYSRSGVLYEAYRSHFGKDDGGVLVWKSDTLTMNPTIDKKVIDQALKDDYSAAKSEWMAEFREDISSFLSLELIEAAVIPGRFELPKIENVSYFAFTDPSGGRQDSFTLAISHKEEDGKIVLDAIRETKPPFQPKDVVEEYSELLKSYGLYSVTGDRYAGEWVTSAFRDNGIVYENSERSKSQIYVEFLPPISNGSVELLDNKRLVSQLRSLERKTRSGGKDFIDNFFGHDDVANVVSASCVLASQKDRDFLLIASPGLSE